MQSSGDKAENWVQVLGAVDCAGFEGVSGRLELLRLSRDGAPTVICIELAGGLILSWFCSGFSSLCCRCYSVVYALLVEDQGLGLVLQL